MMVASQGVLRRRYVPRSAKVRRAQVEASHLPAPPYRRSRPRAIGGMGAGMRAMNALSRPKIDKIDSRTEIGSDLLRRAFQQRPALTQSTVNTPRQIRKDQIHIVLDESQARSGGKRFDHPDDPPGSRSTARQRGFVNSNTSGLASQPETRSRGRGVVDTKQSRVPAAAPRWQGQAASSRHRICDDGAPRPGGGGNSLAAKARDARRDRKVRSRAPSGAKK